ncbi:MAG: 5-formyltetrahydrofolate cyclo-ligase [Actinomycetota bacterium]|jgi:5-formyltetrahydrofolate cyclo-ligase|nr:5-formyltetrahydrofolate cyclo-ligase [Rubrobacter sp.]MDQ3506860.1 5-formyltetrahydrofolate cyclo-ligase [Actinomycetota bacterium]
MVRDFIEARFGAMSRPMDPLPEAKRRMRAEVLRRRESLGEEARGSLGAKVLDRIKSLPAYRSAAAILAFSGFGSELDTEGFLRSVLEDGKVLALPRVVREDGARLELHAVESLGRDLRPGTWGILEPRGDLPKIRISEVDFALIPGVAFDGKGGRLGYGGGFYDKLLANLDERPELVAGAFGVQIVAEVPKEPHDIALDLTVTETSCFPPGERI